ncbi:MAG: hypothetical protein MAG795_00702 [Candidatus Woesearchaeota archaeon]|nr:hypothetical protein [Candidatus Woesearchaeota archaeon]
MSEKDEGKRLDDIMLGIQHYSPTQIKANNMRKKSVPIVKWALAGIASIALVISGFFIEKNYDVLSNLAKEPVLETTPARGEPTRTLLF